MSYSLIVLVTFISIIPLILITLALLRYLKGHISITMKKFTFAPGDCIAGQVNLDIRKETHCERLYAVLLCTERTRGEHSQTIEHYREELDLETNRTFRANTKNQYNFEFIAPDSIKNRQAETGNAFVDTFANQLIKASSGRKKWTIEVSLNCPGIDLYSSKSIHVNLAKS